MEALKALVLKNIASERFGYIVATIVIAVAGLFGAFAFFHPDSPFTRVPVLLVILPFIAPFLIIWFLWQIIRLSMPANLPIYKILFEDPSQIVWIYIARGKNNTYVAHVALNDKKEALLNIPKESDAREFMRLAQENYSGIDFGYTAENINKHIRDSK
jgi:hypothetical protein